MPLFRLQGTGSVWLDELEGMKDVFQGSCVALGGLSLFLYGMHLAGQGLQGVSRMGAFLSAMTRGSFSAISSGVGLAFALQSSSAATVILVSLSEASVLRLSSAFLCALGAGIGTALTVELISFDPSSAVYIFTAAGVGLTLIATSPLWRGMGRVVLGFSLLFLGMNLLKQGTTLLLGRPGTEVGLGYVTDSVILSFLASTGATLVVQSSAAILAIAMALAHGGGIEAGAALGVILGTNLGTCITAWIASIRGGRRGKAVALWHMGFKLIGALALLPLCPHVARILAPWNMDVVTPRWIAHGHAIYNVGLVLFFFPWSKPMAALAWRWAVKDPKKNRFSELLLQAERTDPGQLFTWLETRLLLHADEIPKLLVQLGDWICSEDLQMEREMRAKTGKLEQEIDDIILALLGKERDPTLSEPRKVALLRMAFALGSMFRQIREDCIGCISSMKEEGVQFSVEGESDVRFFLVSCADFMDGVVRRMQDRSDRTSSVSSDTQRESWDNALETLRREEGILFLKHVSRLKHGIKESRGSGMNHTGLMAKAFSLCREMADVSRWHRMEE